MSETSFDKSRNLKIYARCNEAGVSKTFTFLNEDATPHAITSYNFKFPVYDKPGGTLLFELAIGDGLNVSGAGENVLTFELSQERATRRPKVYFGALYAEAEDHTWINSDFIFHNGKFDGVDPTTTITIAANGGSVNITVAGGGNSTPPAESSYLVYSALISQSGSNDPEANVLQNTLGESITWTRIGSGQYKGTKDTVFDDNKTACDVGSVQGGTGYWLRASDFGDGDVQLDLQTILNVSGYSDSLLNRVFIEIRVYP